MQTRLISMPPPTVWEALQGQNVVQDASSLFLLLRIITRPHVFRCFYLWNSSEKGALKVDALSSILSTGAIRPPEDPIQLTTEVHSFGSLDDYELGVIYVHRESRPGQVLTLSISYPGGRNLPWTIHPLKQLRDEPQGSRGGVNWADMRKYLPAEIEILGPVMHEQVMCFRRKVPEKNAENVQGIFILENDPERVQVISRADYLAIAGKRKRSDAY